MEIDKYHCLSNGIYVEQLTSTKKFSNLIEKIKPVKTKFELIRVGGDNDGGCLISNDLNGIVACFSPGVDKTASFEHDLLNKWQINSHLADYSVNFPPENFIAKSFEKIYLGPINNEMFTTLDNWVKRKEENDVVGDFILQMDIEGGEYRAIAHKPVKNH